MFDKNIKLNYPFFPLIIIIIIIIVIIIGGYSWNNIDFFVAFVFILNLSRFMFFIK